MEIKHRLSITDKNSLYPVLNHVGFTRRSYKSLKKDYFHGLSGKERFRVANDKRSNYLLMDSPGHGYYNPVGK